MLDYKELCKSKELKKLMENAAKSPKGDADCFIHQNGKVYLLNITQVKK